MMLLSLKRLNHEMEMASKNGYYFDLDAICDFISGERDEKSKNTVIKEFYGLDEETHNITLLNREITEEKSSDDSQKVIRHNIVDKILSEYLMTDGNDSEDAVSDTIINTALAYGFVKEIK